MLPLFTNNIITLHNYYIIFKNIYKKYKIYNELSELAYYYNLHRYTTSLNGVLNTG